MLFLTADIGGTNARFALFEKNNNKYNFLEAKELSSRGAKSFVEIICNLYEKYPQYSPHLLKGCVIVAAGIQKNENSIQMTNVSWAINLKELKEKISNFPPTLLVNDFAGQAMACCTNIAENFVPLFVKESNNTENMQEINLENSNTYLPLVIMGAGTGLGYASLAQRGNKVILLPSEAGHQAFPFLISQNNLNNKLNNLNKLNELSNSSNSKYLNNTNNLNNLTNEKNSNNLNFNEKEFSSWLCKEKNISYLSAEHVLSGSGLENLHTFLTKETSDAREIPSTSPAFNIFSLWYARALRNFCLTMLPKYAIISGGIAAKHPHIFNDIFYDEFINSPTHQNLLKSIKIFLNKEEHAALYGATAFFDSNPLK